MIGVDRVDHADDLREQGATVVVDDLRMRSDAHHRVGVRQIKQSLMKLGFVDCNWRRFR